MVRGPTDALEEIIHLLDKWVLGVLGRSLRVPGPKYAYPDF